MPVSSSRESSPDPEPGLRLRKARHDLHNSITHILGFVELVAEEIGETGQGSVLAELALIEGTARELLARIDEELDFNKVGNKPPDLRSLQQKLRGHATRIAGVAEKLQGSPDILARPGLKEDLGRIHGAARRILAVARTAFSGAAKPGFGEPITPAEISRCMPGRGTLPPEPVVGTSPARQGSILVVDDLQDNRELLLRRLSRAGYTVEAADSGRAALDRVAVQAMDLVLLDIFMPEMDGFEVLQQLKNSPQTRDTRVIMLSSADDTETVVKCINLGADDFLPKPFDTTLLLARIESSLSRKRLRDQEIAFLKRLQAEQELSERLLLNILPKPVADRLKQGEKLIADFFPEATVLFTDFVGFTDYAARTTPEALVSALSEIFSAFDHLCGAHGLEKIKMIGDAYMAVAGVPIPRADHAEAAADLALAMQEEVSHFAAESGHRFRMRAGLHTGPLVAGVIGTTKFAYDLWGDTVNLASRMENHAPVGGILVSSATYGLLRGRYCFDEGELLRVKGQGEVLAHTLLGKNVMAPHVPYA